MEFIWQGPINSLWKTNTFEVDSLSNQKDNLKNTIDIIFYYINPLIMKIKKDSSIYELLFQLNNKQELFYNYKIDKRKLFDMSGGIPCQ